MDSLQLQLLRFLQSKNYSPQDASGLARALNLDSAQRPALRHILKEWEKNGKIIRVRQGRYAPLPEEEEPICGKIRADNRGTLFFIADEAGQQALRRMRPTQEGGEISLKVSNSASQGAMDGDNVRVKITRHAPTGYRRRHKGMRPSERELILSVKVLSILRRKRALWVGIYRAEERYGIMKGDGRTSPERVILTEQPPPGLLSGMSVTVRALSYPLGRMEARGRIEHVLGWPQEKGVGIAAIVHKYALATEFPRNVLQETLSLSECEDEEVFSQRDDWRDRCVITIDPASARDYDDAISVSALSTGGWELAVHIADVGHYVKPGSALDEEARKRGNSTYLPDRTLPMLPPRLCDDLCSLKEGETRLTRLCLLNLSDKGEVVRCAFRNAVIRSRKRMDYDTALAVLEGKSSSGLPDVDRMLHEAGRLAKLMRNRRLAQGALDWEFPQIRVELDDNGTPVALKSESADEAHRMIEEFMLAANEAAAQVLRKQSVPNIYRVHERPIPEKLGEFALTAKHYGLSVGNLNSRRDLAQVMEQLKGRRDETILKTALLRAMMKARYSPKPLGHFGLGKSDYCHFTSPIRRYADIIVHRGLTRLIGSGQPLPTPAKLTDIAEHISETERNSAAAEHEAQQLMVLEYMQRQCESDAPGSWSAVMTEVWAQGIALEIPELNLKGFISADDLAAASRWFHEPHARRWISAKGETLSPGGTIRVSPTQVDKHARFIRFKLATESPESEPH